MIKQIYFDFGGVLVDYRNAFKKVCRDFNLDFEDFWDFYRRFDDDLAWGKITTDQFWEKCIEKYGLKNANNYDLIKNWVSDYKIIQPINELIYSLSKTIEIGIISNICPGPWEASLKYGLVPKIKYKKVFLSYKEKMVKPYLSIYEKVLKKSKIKANEILFVDDKKENLVMPQKLGWKTFLFDQEKADDGAKEIRAILNLV